LLDAFYEKTETKKPVLIFVHGFKGFKDWGCWDLLCEKLAEQNFAVFKFNFSHNGTTLDKPLDFDALEAFGENNFSKELDDLGTVIDWIFNQDTIAENELDFETINLIGHSRGGGAVLLKAAEDARINKVCTLASVSDFHSKWTQEVVEFWEKEGKLLILNGRTQQQMPLNFQLYTNYIQNKSRLDIESNCKRLLNSVLLIHGTNDKAVAYTALNKLNNWIENSEVLSIDGANHVFGANHPYIDTELPNHMQKAFKTIVTFFK